MVRLKGESLEWTSLVQNMQQEVQRKATHLRVNKVLGRLFLSKQSQQC